MKSIRLNELAQLLKVDYQGDGQAVFSGVSSLDKAGGSDLAFYDNPHYHHSLLATKAGAVILDAKSAADCPTHNRLITPNPYLIYAKVAELFVKKIQRYSGVHASAVIGKNTQIAADVVVAPQVVIGDEVVLKAGVVIGPHAVIGHRVVIAEGTEIKANVTICDQVTIGKECVIHPGAVIGSDGFGNARDGEAWHKVPQLGGVVIGDRVEVGANTTIDCGAMDDTVIEDGVRLDNLIQIAHNVRIGKNTAIAACTGIAGSTKIGKNCMIGGNVGINGHIEITDKVMITGMTMVTSSLLEPGLYSSGIPVASNREWRKNAVRFKQLDEMARRLKKLEQE